MQVYLIYNIAILSAKKPNQASHILIDYIYSLIILTISILVISFLSIIFLIPYIFLQKKISLLFRNSGAIFLFFCYRLFALKCKIINKNKQQEEQKYIIASNHSSWFEILFLQSLQNNIAFIAKKSFSIFPYFADFLFIQNRGDFIEDADKIIRYRSLCIFPEGVIVEQGCKVKYKRGVAVLARSLGCKVLPITHNIGSIFRKTPFGFYIIKFDMRDKIWIKLHEPILYDDIVYKHNKNKDENAQFNKILNRDTTRSNDQAFVNELQKIIDGARDDL